MKRSALPQQTPPETPAKVNPLRQLIDDIKQLQHDKHRWASLVQVPLRRANDLFGMNADEWKAEGFLDDGQIDEILSKTTKLGPIALNSLQFGLVRIRIAADVREDCRELTIIEGAPMD